MQWVERATAWYLVFPLLQRFLNEAQDEIWAGITQQADKSWQIFKPFIDLLKWNLRLVGPKNGFSNFLDFLYRAWLSRYKSTIEIDFFHQWRKTSGCRARDVQVWRPESEFPWWQTEWQPKYIALAAHAQARRDQ